MKKSSLKIAHLVSLRNVGGIERLYSEFINFPFPDIDVKHHTILAKKDIAPVLLDNIQQGSTSIHTLHYYKGMKIPKWLPILRDRLLQRMLEKIKPDVLLLWSKPKFIDTGNMRRTIKIIFYEHGISWIENDWKYMHKFLNNVDAIICNSFAARRIVELKWDIDKREKIKVCLNAIRPSCVPAVVASKKLNINRPFRLGCAGRLVSVKGIALAIHAVNKLKLKGILCELWLAGNGESYTDLQKLSSELKLENEVKFLGFVDNMTDFFSAIDCFVCPSIREPFGLVCAEAMAHGCPVVAAKVDGIPEVVEDGSTGFCISPSLPVEQYVCFGGETENLPRLVYNPVDDCIEAPKIVDPSILADRIETLCTESGMFERMSMEAVNIAKKKFNYSNHAVDVLRFLQKMVGVGSP